MHLRRHGSGSSRAWVSGEKLDESEALSPQPAQAPVWSPASVPGMVPSSSPHSRHFWVQGRLQMTFLALLELRGSAASWALLPC